MRRVLPILIAFSLVVGLFVGLGGYNRTSASIGSCSADVSPTNIAASSSGTLTFAITNSSEAVINWVKFTTPISGFTITGGSKSGWSASVSGSSVIFTSGTQGLGSVSDYSVNVSTNSDSTQASWTVEASDSGSSTNSVTCSGWNKSVAIGNDPADTTAPNLSGDVTVVGVSDTSVRLEWATNEAATITVNYGLTESLGQSTSSSTLSTSHSVTLGSLTANSTYHFTITYTDVWGNSDSTSDATFALSKGATTTVITTTTTTNTVTHIAKDTYPPRVTIKTDLTQPFERAPTISGIATDDEGIARIEYSIDDGKNWQSVDIIEKQFAKSTVFEFTPLVPDDGNYKIKVRSFDTTGNTSVSEPVTLVIDRLPPQVGNSLINMGPLVITPGGNGQIQLLVGLEYKLTLSSVGGTTDIELSAKGAKNTKNFTLYKNVQTGLWFTSLKFETSDIYTLVANSKDGGGNKTEREIGKIKVIDSGSVLGSDKKPLAKVGITIFMFEQSQKIFVPWDGSYFNQENPIETGTDGNFGFLLPKGKYFLQFKLREFPAQKSEIFELAETTFVNPNISLETPAGIFLGPIHIYFPSIFQRKISINFDREDVSDKNTELNKELPTISIYKGGGQVSTLDFRGKPTILTVLSNWSGFDSNQLNILDATAGENGSINFVPVLSQEKPATAQILAKKLKLAIPIYSDPDGLLTEPLGINQLPAHFFVTRNGVITKVIYGILNSEELLNNIVN